MVSPARYLHGPPLVPDHTEYLVMFFFLTLMLLVADDDRNSKISDKNN